jgi:hypothetical protein
MDRVCELCGSKFRVAPYLAKRGYARFCSRLCFKSRTDDALFWEKVNRDGPIVREELGQCWVWTGGTTTGYGSVRLKELQRSVLAHRYSWKLAHGEWPALCVLHKCDNRPCIRPEHLFLGTHADNTADMMRKGRHRQAPLRGADHPMSKLTWEQVREIRASSEKNADIARRLGIVPEHISRIRGGHVWRE